MSPLDHPRQSVHNEPRCPLCNQRVSLETSKTDEDGNAVHEDCYVAKVRLGEDGRSPKSERPIRR